MSLFSRIYFIRIVKLKTIKALSDYLAKPFWLVYYRFKYNNIAEANKNLWVEIDQIYGWYRGSRYDEISFIGQIKGGNWYKKITKKEVVINSSEKHYSIKQRYLEGKEWHETTLFKERYANRPRQSLKGKNINNTVRIYEEKYDSIYKSIKENGIQPAEKGFAPIYVCIGPRGEILYTDDGNHRLAMAMVIGVKKIPVKVLKRHTEWQKIRELAKLQNPNSFQKKVLIKHINHPDLSS